MHYGKTKKTGKHIFGRATGVCGQEIRTKESDLKELRHKAKEIQKEIEEKQKDELFKALVASGKTIDEVMRFIKATGEDKIE